MPRLAIVTPAGRLILEEQEEALTRITYAGAPAALEEGGEQTPLLAETRRQLEAYFSGRLRVFDLPLRAEGTAFQQAVWRQLCAVPFGGLMTYGGIAHRLGRAGAARAVGMACHVNPIMIVVPCHRIVGADGNLTGYAPGLEVKRFLLRLEGSLPQAERRRAQMVPHLVCP
ncbi:methylated-DNA--[protein]-cysteine S-methyltransferase [uncultured Mailhella sp.]|uniref:methylated-DNA--[protein]-cysteine S-methyltransferase n=1 Tax=uncultured Mailhella sp. TaxID=1981031 RepID=UPI0026202D91|nr:methylated-DNA--[protein]-cysteine S-methyltransferase [uncultured Mailhella sp.]